MTKETWDNHGSGQSTGPDYPGHNPSVGSSSKSSKGGYTETETPSGYKRSGMKRSGRHNCVEE